MQPAAAVLLALAGGAVWGQTADAPVAFEVASIKTSPPTTGNTMWVGISGGPATDDPGRFRAVNMSLEMLVIEAYGIEPYQFSGPDWMSSQRFDITAKVPAGATKAQLGPMLQNLLESRFKLALHREHKEMARYELVLGKNGSKLKESVEGPEPSTPASQQTVTLGKDGFPELPPGRTNQFRTIAGHSRLRGFKVPADRIARIAALQLGRPVIDRTGLNGRYDVEMYWVNSVPADSSDTGPDLFRALEGQLGLKLEQKKGPIEMLVVDHIGKNPTEN